LNQKLFETPIAWDARLVGGTSTGDSTYWTGLLFGLSQLERTPRLLLYSNAPRPSSVPWRPEWQWIELPYSGPLAGRRWSFFTFPKAARAAGAEVIHVQYAMSPLVGRIGVTTIHDVSFFVGPQWFGAKDRFLLQRSVPAAAKRAARVIAVSDTSKGELERYLPGAVGKTRVTKLAAAPWIKPVDRAEAKARVKAVFGEQGPYLLSVGTRWARKNQELAVAAVEGLPANLPHRLLMAGKNPAPFTGSRVRGLGYVSEEDLCALYSGAEAFLFPSLHEGFGIPALEAMSCGTPVVCGNGGALPEVVGDAGIVVPSYEVSAWTEELVKLLSGADGQSGSSNLLSQKGLARASEFSWRATAEATLKVYDEVLSERGS
jgi:glycosyltransferase involved in cell wall biosynthesis